MTAPNPGFVYYVKSGGTAGDSNNGRVAWASRRSGSFGSMDPSTYYDNVEECAEMVTGTPPAAGDLIVVSDAHSKVYGVNTSIYTGHDTRNPTLVVSVSDTDCRAYSRGAAEGNTSTSQTFTMYGSWYVKGLDLQSGYQMTFDDTSDPNCYTFDDVHFNLGDRDLIRFGNQAGGTRVRHYNVDFDCPNDPNSDNSTDLIECYAPLESFGMTLSNRAALRRGASGGALVRLQDSGEARIYAADLSNANTVQYSNVVGDEGSQCHFHGVALADPGQAQDNTWSGQWRVIIDECGTTVVEGQTEDVSGTIYTQDDTLRTSGNADRAWKIVTTEKVSEWFPLASEWMQGYLDDTSQKTITVYIANAGADLDQGEVFLEWMYPGHATNPHYNFGTNRRETPFETLTAWTDDTTSTWSPSLTYMQKISFTVTPARAGPIMVRVMYGKASETTNPLFVDPAIEIT